MWKMREWENLSMTSHAKQRDALELRAPTALLPDIPRDLTFDKGILFEAPLYAHAYNKNNKQWMSGNLIITIFSRFVHMHGNLLFNDLISLLHILIIELAQLLNSFSHSRRHPISWGIIIVIIVRLCRKNKQIVNKNANIATLNTHLKRC